MSRIPTSGAMTWNDIQSSFGGSNPIAINEYYRNSSLVSSSVLNSDIPTSGQIEATDFRGADGFSGTTGTFSCGTSGGKIVANGFLTGGYGSDLGMAFTSGGGIKVTCYAVNGLGGIVGVEMCTASPNTLTNNTSNQLTNKNITLSGAVSFTGGLNDDTSIAGRTVPSSYGGGTGGVRIQFYNVTLPTSGNVNISYS